MQKIDQKKIFEEEKKYIKDNILILGSGRWAKEIIKEIHKNFINVNFIYILTNYKKQFLNWLPKKISKKIIILKGINETTKIDCNFAIIANKTKDHIKYSKYLLKNNYNVLVEKPLFLNEKNFQALVSLSKKKKKRIFLSLQYFFAIYFQYISKKIESKKIKTITFFWFDKKKEKKNKLWKKHNTNISFNTDVFFHIYSILNLFNLNQRFLYFKKNIKINNYENLEFRNNKFYIRLISTRVSKIRKRLIKFNFNNGSELVVNFSNDLNLKVKLNNKTLIVPKKILDTTLKYQLFFFLRIGQTDINNNKNELYKLKKLFHYLEIVKK